MIGQARRINSALDTLREKTARESGTRPDKPATTHTSLHTDTKRALSTRSTRLECTVAGRDCNWQRQLGGTGSWLAARLAAGLAQAGRRLALAPLASAGRAGHRILYQLISAYGVRVQPGTDMQCICTLSEAMYIFLL